MFYNVYLWMLFFFFSFWLLCFPWRGAGAGRWKECEMPLEQNGAAPRLRKRLLLEQAPAPRKSFLPCGPRDEEQPKHSKRLHAQRQRAHGGWCNEKRSCKLQSSDFFMDADMWLSQRDQHAVAGISQGCATSLSSCVPVGCAPSSTSLSALTPPP